VLLLLARNELPVACKPHPVDYARIMLTIAIVVPPVCGAGGGFAMRDKAASGAAYRTLSRGGGFLSAFILAQTAPGERFSFLAIRPTLTRDIIALAIEPLPRVSKGAPPGVDLSFMKFPV
jgi:hypothetical protein